MSKKENEKGILTILEEKYGLSKEDRKTLYQSFVIHLAIGFFIGILLVTLLISTVDNWTIDQISRYLVCGISGLSLLGISSSIGWLYCKRDELEKSA